MNNNINNQKISFVNLELNNENYENKDKSKSKLSNSLKPLTKLTGATT